MGQVLNTCGSVFERTVRTPTYVDQSGMLGILNGFIDDPSQKYVCVTRPRGFGKSVTAQMLTAYYSRGSTIGRLFDDMEISKCPSYEKHLKAHHVIELDVRYFYLSAGRDGGKMIDAIEGTVLADLREAFPAFDFGDCHQLAPVLLGLQDELHESFIFVIDEWDAILRINPADKEGRKKYFDFLTVLLKDRPYVSLAYMTGILPPKVNDWSCDLGVFDVYSMIEPGCFSAYTGFSHDEVLKLCSASAMDPATIGDWYGGYCGDGGAEFFNPFSVAKACRDHGIACYRERTETSEALQSLILSDLQGLNDAVERLVSGDEILIDPGLCRCQMTGFTSLDDVLTLLVHLGYLTVRTEVMPGGSRKYYARIPNYEIRAEFKSCLS